MKTKLSPTLISLMALVTVFALVGCGTQPATPITLENTPTKIIPTKTSIPSTPTPIPSPTAVPKVAAQGYHALAYDEAANLVILKPFQGNNRTILKSSAWEFNLEAGTWQKRADGPPKGDGYLAYDAQSDRTILFTGMRNLPHSGAGKKNGQTWAYDYNSDTWTNMTPEEGPNNLLGPRMAYDSESDRIILFGGWRAMDAGAWGKSYDTWAYDYDTNTWTNMQPFGDIPEGMLFFFPISYDAGFDRVLVWICKELSNGEEDLCAMFAYDYNSNTWERRETESGPYTGKNNAMVYDPGTGLHILFGGTNYDEDEVFGELWGYDYATNTWIELPSINPPSARGWHAMVFHEKASVMVMFGGGDSLNTLTDETWTYDPETGEWEQISTTP